MSYYHYREGTQSETVFWKGVALCFILLSVIELAGMWSMSNRVDPAKLVHQICNESRIDLSISERGCGELQDQLRMEFMCEQNNTDPDNYCWVEEN